MTTTTNESAVAGRVATDPRPVADYARISKRKTGDGHGKTLGVTRQHEDCTDYAARVFPGADVVTYDDNLSAWDPDVFRAGWETLLDDVRAGTYRAVVGWHSDRFTRQPAQLEALWAACKAGGAELHTVTGGQVQSMVMLRIQAALAAEESDQKSRRMARKHAQLAATGKPHGGRRRWGYEPGMTAVREDEAAVIRDVAARLLRGETLHAICRDLTARGVPTVAGGAWTGPNLRNMMQRPHLAGVRTHNGAEYPADWPAILTRETHDRLVVLFNRPDRKTSTGNARVYLLAGLALCACGAKLRARPRTGRGEAPAYFCSTGRHVHRRVDLVDDEVVDTVVDRLSRMDAAGLFVADDRADDLARLRDEAAALAAQHEAMATDLSMSVQTVALRTAAIEARRDQVEATIRDLTAATARPSAVLNGVTGPAAPAVWETLTLDRKRAVIDVLATVTLAGGRRWSPDDVDVDWR